MSREDRATYIPSLDGWRALAVMSVVFFHGYRAFGFETSQFGLVRKLWPYGILGVDVFFAISGLLICSKLLEEKKANGSVNLLGFYLRRAFRILPASFFFLLAMTVLGLVGVLAVQPHELVACLLFFRNYSTDPGWYTAHFWSLALEEHFYFFAPFLIKQLSWKRALWVSLLGACAVIIWRGIEVRYEFVQRTFGPTNFIVNRTDARLDALLFPCAFALLLTTQRFREFASDYLDDFAFVVAIGVLVGAIAFDAPVIRAFQSFLFPVLVGSTAWGGAKYARRVLECAPLRFIGRISYSIYLWQQVFMVGDPAEYDRAPLGLVQRAPFNLIAVFACAIASYYLVEQPLLRFGRRVIQRVQVREPLASPVGS